MSNKTTSITTGSSGSLYPNPNVTWCGSSEKVSIIQLVSDSDDADDDTIPELVSDSDDDTLNNKGSCLLGHG